MIQFTSTLLLILSPIPHIYISFLDKTMELKGEKKIWRKKEKQLQAHVGTEMIQTITDTGWGTKKGCE